MELCPSSRRSSGVEQLIRNQQVAGSNPIAGSIKSITYTVKIKASKFPGGHGCEKFFKHEIFALERLAGKPS
jgi:hypothetical protein